MLSLGALLGLTLGLGFGFFVLGMIAFLLCRHRWKKIAAKGTWSVSCAEAGQPAMSTAVAGHTDAPVLAREAAPEPPAQPGVEDADKGKGKKVAAFVSPRSGGDHPEGSRAAEARALDGTERTGRAL